MGLTIKQENFCLAYLETGNASEAYRSAYDSGKMKPSTINRKAKLLMDQGKIRARLEKLREDAVKRTEFTFDGHMKALERLRDKAEDAGKYQAAISAEISRGKAAGFYVEKKNAYDGAEIKVDMKKIREMSDEELLAIASGAARVQPINAPERPKTIAEWQEQVREAQEAMKKKEEGDG